MLNNSNVFCNHRHAIKMSSVALIINSMFYYDLPPATSKMERFLIIVNGWKPLIIITKRSILDVAAALDPPLCLS